MKKITALKLSLLLPMAGLLMGNQSCDKKPPVVEARQLKKIVEVGMIESRPVFLPDGNIFDFQFVVNQQIYSVLYDSKAFAFRYNSPTVGLGVLRDGSVMSQLNLSRSSAEYYEKVMGKSASALRIASEDASCLVNMPQARIGGAVTSFELVKGGGIGIGFSPAGNMNMTGLGAEFDMKVYQLELILRALSPMTGSDMGEIASFSKKVDMKVSFHINFGEFSIGPSYFQTTPMADVTRKALTESVLGLKEALKKRDWFTRVLDMREDEDNFVIIGGNNVDLKAGDQLMVYRETYYWKGEPCNSELEQEGGGNPVALALIEVTNVDEELSTAHVIEYKQDLQPSKVIGSKVKLVKLNEDKPPAAP